ncbi:hypothetical protein O181_027024 [Austropuccinia psidii MF-1]|uniref:Heme peroxidase n=1 Tax=Austropuccinia psidii MF-1 TaxID=1389203 RepID=A0A9Q3CNB4_9BASI|nr:hypothetical protein [Austropuccinia psidii MF-1]
MSFSFDKLNQQPLAFQPKSGERFLQSAGYTRLLRISSVPDPSPTSCSSVWRRVTQLQSSIGTITNYFFAKTRKRGTTEKEEADPVDLQEPTPFSYFALQQLFPGRVPRNPDAIREVITSLGKPLDDRKLLFEDVITMLATASKLPGHGLPRRVNAFQGHFLNLLWDDLSHPPTVDLLPEHRYRSADGSHNNLTGFPLLGAARQPYARSVKPLHRIPPDIAEPEELFDAILRRDHQHDGFKQHPYGISSLLFAFANIIIHDLFWTKHEEPWQNLTSSYISLDPLYGIDLEEQEKVRDNMGENLGRGLLYNDTFASKRLLMMPPASAALLILFSRNHNRVARKVLELNERNQWKREVESLLPEQRRKQDDEIFGTARHVNCAYFTGIILSDYLQTILGTIPVDSDWRFDPRLTIKSLLGSTPKATGNSVSVEFNILYRWHSTISLGQERWLENKMAKGLPSREWDKLDSVSFQRAIDQLKKELSAEDGSEPRHWKLSRLHLQHTSAETHHLPDVYDRDPDTGKFRDAVIAKLLKESTSEFAGAFGARGVPAVLKWVDCQAMHTARDIWRVCTLNEFRQYFNLKPFKTFAEWNSNTEIASAMEELVGHPSNIPLYAGLHGEEAKEPRPGAGLCPGYTISRAILSDAVALVRGDRFYTDCATADAMTDWGLKDCQPDIREGSYGGLMQKLIINNLPNQYCYNDVALLFPFMVPEKIYDILKEISPDKACHYSLRSPNPPKPFGFSSIKIFNERTLVYELSDSEIVQKDRMEKLFGTPHMRSNISTVYDCLFSVVDGNEWNKFESFIREMISKSAIRRSKTTKDLTLDICRNVINPLVSGWLAHMLGLCEIGLHSRQLLLTALSDVYVYLTESQMTYKTQSSAKVVAEEFVRQIRYHIESAIAPSSIGKLVQKGTAMVAVGALNALEDTLKFLSPQNSTSDKNLHRNPFEFYTRLVAQNSRKDNLTSDELAADCFRAVATLAYSLTHGSAHALDYLITPESLPSEEKAQVIYSLKELNRQIREDTSRFEQPQFRDRYTKYGLEATRLNHWVPELQGFIYKVDRNSTVDKGHIGMIDCKCDLSRDQQEYAKLLDSTGHCLKFYKKVICVIVKEVTSLPDVQRAPGRQGELSKIQILDSVSGIPTMHIRYNGQTNCPVGNKQELSLSWK